MELMVSFVYLKYETLFPLLSVKILMMRVIDQLLWVKVNLFETRDINKLLIWDVKSWSIIWTGLGSTWDIDKYLSSVLRIEQALNKTSLSLGNTYRTFDHKRLLHIFLIKGFLDNNQRVAHHLGTKMTSWRHKASACQP